mmetsp:Transcript_70208/g.138019  ORF Transcript_70208/g.138019 Transcript_70208/m.138019 type:complete len:230 (+) Transcript_70208:167-856(+)
MSGVLRRNDQTSNDDATAGRFRDPMESVSDKISEHLNRFHAATILLVAWHYTGRRDTIVAQMIQVDRLGFEVRCHFYGGLYSEERVNFSSGPIDNANVMINYIVGDMRREAAFSKWPNGPLMKAMVAIYMILCVVWYESHGGEDMTFLPQSWQPHLPKRNLLHWGFVYIVAANLVQACACLFVLTRRLKLLDRNHYFGWFATCFVVGYPAWSQVLALKRSNTQGRLKRL